MGCLPPGVGTRAGRSGGVAVATAIPTGGASTVATGATAVGWSTATHATAVAAGAATAPLGAGVGRTLATTESTNIASGSGTTAATTRATTTAATAAETAALTSNGLEECWDLLVSFLEKLEEIANDTTVATVEESGGNTSVSGTTGTTDTVDVVVDVGGEIVVDNVLDVGDIETTSGDSGGDEDRAACVTEHLEGALTFALGPITVNGSGRETLVDQEVGERISHTLGLDEDQGETSTVSVEDIEKDRALVDILNVLNLLGDVLRGRSDTSNREEDILLEEVAGEHLDITGEGGGKHESLTASSWGHVLALDDTTDLRLKTHVQHAISLVKDEVLDVLEGDAASLYEVDETSRSGNKKIASALDLAELGADVGTTVDNTWADPRTVGELASLVEDLGDKLTSGCENERGGVRLPLASETSLSRSVGAGSMLESLGEDGEEETTSLAGTGLGTSHQVTTTHDNGDGVLLDGSRNLVAGKLNVGNEVVIERRVGEGGDRLGDSLSGSLDGDVVVLLEVDAGLLLGRVVGDAIQLTLDAGVRWAGDVLAVSPLTVS